MKLARQREMFMRVPCAEWLTLRGISFYRASECQGWGAVLDADLAAGTGFGWNGLRGIRPGPKGPAILAGKAPGCTGATGGV
jgi:hypothetical protein